MSEEISQLARANGATFNDVARTLLQDGGVAPKC